MPRRFGGKREIGRPSSRISPAVGSSKPASIMRQVVLPEPEGPSKREELASRDIEIEAFHHERRAVIALLHAHEANERSGIGTLLDFTHAQGRVHGASSECIFVAGSIHAGKEGGKTWSTPCPLQW